MRDIRDSKRRNANPEMWEVSKSYTDDDIQVVVDYMSWLPSVRN
jgi:cytochrome c553